MDGDRIGLVVERLEERVSRLESRAHADYRQLAADIQELKTAVGVLGVKVDERSVPRHLHLVAQEPREAIRRAKRRAAARSRDDSGGRNGEAFVTIVSVVASAIGLFLALRADIGKRIDRTEERIDRVEDRLGKRIDRVEDRARADRLEFVAEISQMKTSVSAQIAELNATVSAQTTELKTAVGVLGAKLDERSAPQRLVVQEPRADYKEPEDGPDA